MDDNNNQNNDSYITRFNYPINRRGKIFSYTFWRTQINGDVFWSMQGHEEDGSAWIATQYFGPAEEASRYQQLIVLTHPVETKIKMVYHSTCEEGRNKVHISKTIVQNFKNDDNSFDFEFKMMRLKRRHKRMMDNIYRSVYNYYIPIENVV